MKTVAVVQSNYIPWKGYFDLIGASDLFVLLDEVQFTRRDWRNRNVIKTAQGPIWLTIPVRVKGRYHQKISETEVSSPEWAEQHFTTLRHAYARAPYFERYEVALQSLYEEGARLPLLSDVNRLFTDWVCKALGIETPIVRSERFETTSDRVDRLVGICSQAGATRYLSGPTARGYLDHGRFEAVGIDVAYFDYDAYPEYVQLHGPFEHAVSVIDLLVHAGPEAPRYMKALA